MVTLDEVRKCQAYLKNVYGEDLNMSHLEELLESSMQSFSGAYQRGYNNLINGNFAQKEVDFQMAHYYEIRLATLTAMINEAKKRG